MKKISLIIIFLATLLLFFCSYKNDEDKTVLEHKIELKLKCDYKYSTQYTPNEKEKFVIIIPRITVVNISDKPFFVYSGYDAFNIFEMKDGGYKYWTNSPEPDPDKADWTTFIPLMPKESFTITPFSLSPGQSEEKNILIGALYKVPYAFKKCGGNIWVGELTSNTLKLTMSPPFLSLAKGNLYLIRMLSLVFILTIISILIYRTIRGRFLSGRGHRRVG